MKTIIAAALSILIAGCVVVPHPRGSTVYVEPEIYYPQVATLYIWEPSMGVYYFMHQGRRCYMPHGWKHEHGYPKHKYKYNR